MGCRCESSGLCKQWPTVSRHDSRPLQTTEYCSKEMYHTCKRTHKHTHTHTHTHHTHVHTHTLLTGSGSGSREILTAFFSRSQISTVPSQPAVVSSEEARGWNRRMLHLSSWPARQEVRGRRLHHSNQHMRHNQPATAQHPPLKPWLRMY